MVAELEPMGSDAGAFNPFVTPPAVEGKESTYPAFAALTRDECNIYGIPAPCSQVMILDYIYPKMTSGGTTGTNADPLRFELIGMPPGPVPIDFNPDFLKWMYERGHSWTEENLHDLDREYIRFLRQQNPTPSPTPAEQKPIWCQPDVIEAMERAWSESRNGGMANSGASGGVEAGFNINGTLDNYTIDHQFTNQQNKMTIRYNTLNSPMPTFANFHVHPKGRDGNNGAPSTPGNNSEGNGRGDIGKMDDIYKATGQAIQIYVMSRYGLSMYDPKTGQTTQLREGLDFLDKKKPCP